MRPLVPLLYVLGACGGKLDAGDGGVVGPDGSPGQHDGSTLIDAAVVDVIVMPTCGPMATQGMTGPSACQVSSTWSCGATQYSVQCDCPNATCSCAQQTGSMGSGTIVKVPSYCPGCMGSLAQLCGFPSQ